MYKRNLYIDKIKPYVNKPAIKVITGMRCAGKSYLLKLIIENIKAERIIKEHIVYINMESLIEIQKKSPKTSTRYRITDTIQLILAQLRCYIRFCVTILKAAD